MTYLHDPMWPNDSNAVSHSSLSEGSMDWSLPSIDEMTILTPELNNTTNKYILVNSF